MLPDQERKGFRIAAVLASISFGLLAFGSIAWMAHATGEDAPKATAPRYAAPTVRAIKSSQLVALMCSRNAFKSDYVIREIYIAGDCKKPFLVFQLDHAEFPDEVLYFVTGFPRLSVTALDPQGLRTELSRLLVN